MHNLAILGSTGSIGQQTLDIVRRRSRIYNVKLLAGNLNLDLLCKQASEFKPEYLCVASELSRKKLKTKLPNYADNIFLIDELTADLFKHLRLESIVIAIPGFAGVRSTIEAAKTGKRLILANKESLVVAGNIISSLITKFNTTLLPIDSEHSAIFQCIQGENVKEIEKIVLTCSGGPFFGKTIQEIDSYDQAYALKHPI